jgi:hypothetical protein
VGLNMQAFRIVGAANSENAPLGAKIAASRKGGIKDESARAKSITPDRRVEIATKASETRWNKKATA